MFNVVEKYSKFEGAQEKTDLPLNTSHITQKQQTTDTQNHNVTLLYNFVLLYSVLKQLVH